MSDQPRSVDTLASELRALGVAEGDLVMVHASLRAIGPVEHRAHGVIDAVLEAVGGRGTMMMVLGARNDHAWVNERPEPERAALLADAQPFDAWQTPASADVGTLAEVFRRRPETRVSDHPEGRFAAIGPMAEALLADVPWDDYFGPGSPLQRLLDAHGRILRLGADQDTVTALHHAEYRCGITDKRRARRYRLVTTPEGPSVRVVECLDDEEGIVEYEGEDYFADVLRDYLELGRHRSGMVGGARSELLDAADIVAFGTTWMDEHLAGRAATTDASTLGSRLDADLMAARRRRDSAEVSAIRSLKSALANAEAVPVEERPYELVEGSADVPRRRLTPRDVVAVIEAEIKERRRAIDAYEAAVVDTGDLERELETLLRYR